MRFQLLTRRIHYWASFLIAAPAIVVICTGILLQLKKEVPWVQPPERKGTGKSPMVGFDVILERCRSIPEAQVGGWGDIRRIDVRPAKGLIKVTCSNDWEVQIDGATGDVLQAAYRRSDLIESMHDGSWFHDRVKLWVFLPAAVGLLILWLTGVYLFWLPRVVRWRRGRRGS